MARGDLGQQTASGDLFYGSKADTPGTFADFTPVRDSDHDPFERDPLKIATEYFPDLCDGLFKDQPGSGERI